MSYEATGLRRYELSDAQWGWIADLMPRSNPHGGGVWRDHRQVVDGLMWKLNTGAQWRDIPERYGPWQTIYERFVRWRCDGLFERILDRLRLQLDADGRIDVDLWCIDGTSIRASRSAAGGGKRGVRMNRTIMHSAGRAGVLEPKSTS